jgi:hypothetical protein
MIKIRILDAKFNNRSKSLISKQRGLKSKSGSGLITTRMNADLADGRRSTSIINANTR